MSKMNLREDIKKATLLPLSEDDDDEDPRFFRLQGLSQAARDHKMNERKVRIPQNIDLLEDSDDDINHNYNSIIDKKMKPTFDRHAVSAAIKEVNGGLDLSNRHWEKYWSKHLEEINNSKDEKSQKSSARNDINSHSEKLPETKELKDVSVKLKHRIFRNAAIMGLINTKKISLEDVIISNTIESSTETEKVEASHRNASNDTAADGTYQVELVPLCEDDEIFVHPLRLGIDVKQHKDIDFTVGRVGKKTKETPQRYFLRTTNDDSFIFIKKNKSTT